MKSFKIPEINTILLDMDGPLVDDFKMFSSLSPEIEDMEAHIAMLKIFGKKQDFVFPLIEKAIKMKAFQTAPPTNFCHLVRSVLLPFWKEKGINVEILTSTMAVNPKRKELEDQKLIWLQHNLPNLDVVFAEGSAKKQECAKAGVLLIDDYDRTIGQFIGAGGYGIQYRNLQETMSQLRLIGLAPSLPDL